MAADARVVPVGDVDRPVGGDAQISGAEPGVAAIIDLEHVDRVGLVARAGSCLSSDPGLTSAGGADLKIVVGTSAAGMGDVGADDIAAGVAVKQGAAVWLGKQVTFVDTDAGRRARAGVQQVGHDARETLVPVGFLAGSGRGTGSRRGPSWSPLGPV